MQKYLWGHNENLQETDSHNNDDLIGQNDGYHIKRLEKNNQLIGLKG